MKVLQDVCVILLFTLGQKHYILLQTLKLPIPSVNFKNTSKVVLSLFTAFYKKYYNLASTIYTPCQSYFTRVNKMALMRMVHYETSKPHI